MSYYADNEASGAPQYLHKVRTVPTGSNTFQSLWVLLLLLFSSLVLLMRVPRALEGGPAVNILILATLCQLSWGKWAATCAMFDRWPQCHNQLKSYKSTRNWRKGCSLGVCTGFATIKNTTQNKRLNRIIFGSFTYKVSL